jgi:hypothetical protein
MTILPHVSIFHMSSLLAHAPTLCVERLYWATSAAEVMRGNPGHYVAFVTHRTGTDTAAEKPHHLRRGHQGTASQEGGEDTEGAIADAAAAPTR